LTIELEDGSKDAIIAKQMFWSLMVIASLFAILFILTRPEADAGSHAASLPQTPGGP